MFILVFIFTLLILVLIHEAGHFFAAKKFGIKVLEFGFGLPPRAIGKKIGETLYSLNWLPLGGFVKLMGEDETDREVLKDKRSFAVQPVWKRITVVIAGVFMNLILAWVLFYIVIAAQNFQVMYPVTEPVVSVAAVEQNFPAQKAGVKPGEIITQVNGTTVGDIQAARKIILSSKDKPVMLTLTNLDGGDPHNLTMTPQKNPEGRYIVGIVFSPIPFKHYTTVPDKLFSGITYSWDMTEFTFLGLGKLFTDIGSGKIEKASQSVSGPIGLASMTNEIVSLGSDAWIPYLWFMGILSLTLAIFNFLPIPALDGGRLFFLYIEALSGKKLNPEMEARIHQVTFMILIGLMLVVAYSDVHKICTAPNSWCGSILSKSK